MRLQSGVDQLLPPGLRRSVGVGGAVSAPSGVDAPVSVGALFESMTIVGFAPSTNAPPYRRFLPIAVVPSVASGRSAAVSVATAGADPLGNGIGGDRGGGAVRRGR